MKRPYDQDIDEHCIHCGSNKVHIITVFGAECKTCMEVEDAAVSGEQVAEWVEIIPSWRWN